MSDQGAGPFLGRIAARLRDSGIPHMVVGSFASSFHGVPRASQDLDLVVDPTPATLEVFLASLSQADYYVDVDAARDALRGRGQFNVIDMATAWKADLIIRKARPFSIEELRRRIEGIVYSAPVHVATPEDTILAKLEWARQGGGSVLQLRDAAGIVQVRGRSLDRLYIETWAAVLGISDLWEDARAAAEKVGGP